MNLYVKHSLPTRISSACLVLSVLQPLLMPGAVAATSETGFEASPALADVSTLQPAQSQESLPAPVAKPDVLLAASIQGTSDSQKLETLTRQIALKEAELLRLNTHFRIECTKISKWKPWRLFFYNLAASGTSNAGITSITATRWRYWPHPRDMSRETAKTGPILLLIGHCITLGGVLAETAFDMINDHKARKKGYDIKTTHKRVIQIKSDLDSLLAQRQALLDQPNTLSSSELTLARAEGAVLKDVRDLALNEYAQFYVRAKKFFSSRTTNAVMATTAATTGGFQGSLLGIVSAVKRKPRLVGPGGLGFVISGAAIMATPPTTKLVSSISGRAAKKKIQSELGDIAVKSVSQLNDDRTTLANAVQQSTGSDSNYSANVSSRLLAYTRQSELFGAQADLSAKEKALANKEFKERLVYASLIGGSKMSWGINLSNAGFQFHPRSKIVPGPGKKLRVVNDPGPARNFTRRVAIGATTYVPGTSLWIFDTLQSRIRGEIRNHRLSNQKALPSDLLGERMDRVEQIEEVFNY